MEEAKDGKGRRGYAIYTEPKARVSTPQQQTAFYFYTCTMSDVGELTKPTVEHTEKIDDPLVTDESVLQHVDDDAEVRRIIGPNPESVVIDKQLDKKLFWVVNRRLMPLLVVYLFQSLDKSLVNLSSIMGLVDDTGLVGNQYSLLGTILYLGTFVAEIPTNIILQKLPVAKVLCVSVFFWGAITCATAGVHNFAGLAITRVFLGIFETVAMPCFVMITQMWYRREEQLFMMALWGGMPGVQVMIGGLLAYGVAHYNGDVMYSWQLLFLILGLATVVLAFFIGWYIPDSPVKAKCFDDDQKRLLILRVRQNETGVQSNKKTKWYQVREALADPAVWFMFFIQVISCFFTGGLNFYSNIIVKSFGFTLLETELLNLAQGAVILIAIYGTMYAAQRLNQTMLVLLATGWIPLTGMIIVMKVNTTESTRVGLLIAYYMTMFTWPIGDTVNSLISRNISGSTKRTTVLILNFIAWSGANAAGPQAFASTSEKARHRAFKVDIVLFCIYYCLLICLRVLLWNRNRKRSMNAIKDESGNEVINHDTAFADLTDLENPNFRYKL